MAFTRFSLKLPKTGIQDIDYEQEGVLYACSECDYKASYNENVLKHFKAKHEGVKYACSKCDY